MPGFKYEALDASGKTIKKSVEADNIDAARAKLKQQGLSILNIEEENLFNKDISFSFAKKVPVRDLSIFCRQFVSMNRAGVPIMECLDLLWRQTENQTLSQSIRQMQADVQKGESFASAMGKITSVFPPLMVTTVAAGEASGSLDLSLERMADQFERSSKTQALVKKAMIYPIIVAIVAIAVVIVMLVVVIPSYTDMFNDLGTELPAITKAVVAMSDFIMQKWYLLIIIVGIVGVAFTYFLQTPTGRLITSKLALKVPVVKNLTIKSACSQLSRTLSTLLSAGVPLVEAVDIVANTMQNVIIHDALKDARDEVIKGVPLSVPLEECGHFPPMLYHMLSIGEESGSTEAMLSKMADYYDEEVENATQSLLAVMEPMIMIVLAAIVCVLVAAIMSPMLTMYEALDNL